MFSVVAFLAICCYHSLGVLGTKVPGICPMKDNHLDCNGRELDRVPSLTNSAEKYSSVDLSNNKLTQLQSKTFEKFTNLETLNLAKNKIVDIKDGAFTGLSKLRVLDISGNQLTTFNLAHLAPLVSLKTLAIHNNQFYCDCSLEPIMEFVKKTQRKDSKYKVPDVNQIKCHGSDLVEGKALVSLSKELLCNVNECTRGCSKFASCIDTGGSYECRCNKGFIGNGKMCQDVNECATACPHKCDPKRAFCANTIGSYMCFCRNGFQKIFGQCHDLDECQVGLHKCGSHAVCSNNVGSYSCTCQDGYHGDGYICIKTKVAEQYGIVIGLRYIVLCLIAIIVCIPLLWFANYWLKQQRTNREKKYEKRQKHPVEKFLTPSEKRLFVSRLLQDIEKGDPEEEVVYMKPESEAREWPQNTAVTPPTSSESHEKKCEFIEKQLHHEFRGSFKQDLHNELFKAIFKRQESAEVSSPVSSSSSSSGSSSSSSE